MLPIYFTSDALNDIEEAVIWYEEQRPGLSYDFELCMEAGINEILRTPTAFQIRHKNVQVHYIKRFPFGIHYLYQEDSIVVMGVFHTSRSPKNWKTRTRLPK